MLLLSLGISQEEECEGAIPEKHSRSRWIDDKTQKKLSLMQHLLQSRAARKQTSITQDPVFHHHPLQVSLIVLKQLSLHMIHASGWKAMAIKAAKE